MEDIISHLKMNLDVSTCSLIAQPKGGIVNEGKAAVIEADGKKFFVKYNDTSLVGFHTQWFFSRFLFRVHHITEALHFGSFRQNPCLNASGKV